MVVNGCCVAFFVLGFVSSVLHREIVLFSEILKNVSQVRCKTVKTKL